LQTLVLISAGQLHDLRRWKVRQAATALPASQTIAAGAD
jgi:hypothetical protein